MATWRFHGNRSVQTTVVPTLRGWLVTHRSRLSADAIHSVNVEDPEHEMEPEDFAFFDHKDR